jgi:centrosomal protein CEP104
MKIYCCVGSKLLNLIAENKSLRPAQIDTLSKGFSELETDTYQEPKAQTRQPIRNDREIRETKDYREQKLNIAMCEFCGKNDPSFAKQDALDIHYWKDCPMLVACLQCSQVVEVLHLNLHMLRECELSELVDQCPRCKEAINLDDFEMHVEEQACLSAKPITKANRCPLCHDDVEPGQNGWIRHVLKEGCPNNDRSNY